ncbi:hypothetical protein TgHK011_004881 [Trichoderma gracile]|nr:hypothetical protein TgHK011_004881 [Trichoderma gracile]
MTQLARDGKCGSIVSNCLPFMTCSISLQSPHDYVESPAKYLSLVPYAALHVEAQSGTGILGNDARPSENHLISEFRTLHHEVAPHRGAGTYYSTLNARQSSASFRSQAALTMIRLTTTRYRNALLTLEPRTSNIFKAGRSPDSDIILRLNSMAGTDDYSEFLLDLLFRTAAFQRDTGKNPENAVSPIGPRVLAPSTTSKDAHSCTHRQRPCYDRRDIMSSNFSSMPNDWLS